MKDTLAQIISDDEKIKEEAYKIADIIIKEKISIREAAKRIEISKSKACDLINKKLPCYSKEKYLSVRKVLDSHKSVKLSNDMIDRIEFEYSLLMRGYTLCEIAYLLDGTYSTVQRDLSSRTYDISKEMGISATARLKQNKEKILKR